MTVDMHLALRARLSKRRGHWPEVFGFPGTKPPSLHTQSERLSTIKREGQRPGNLPVRFSRQEIRERLQVS